MYPVKIQKENQGKTQKVVFFHREKEQIISFKEAIQLLQTDTTFQSQLNSILADSPYPAFRWETPPITKNTVKRNFEFVIIESRLTKKAKPNAFSEFFNNCPDSEKVVVFPNLGKDAILIVPTPQNDLNIYAHLATFVRGASTAQQQALWQKVGLTLSENLSDVPLWLNTAGGGVPWLHIRLDSKPKYYRYKAYKT